MTEEALKPVVWDETAPSREYVDMLKGEIEAQRARLSDAQAALAEKDKRIAELKCEREEWADHALKEDDCRIYWQDRATSADASAARLRALLAEAREVVERARQNTPEHFSNWHDAARALAEKLEKEKAE